MPPDGAQRAAALDTSRSFIVQAPAGSGKTGLLTQRYLALLSRSPRPEDVLAITFTRKAAAEMRERVLAAIVAANTLPAGGECLDDCEPHQRLTLELALAVCATDRRLGWRIQELPSRLKITTIDGLCRSLSSQMPWLSGFGGAMVPSDNADDLYAQVARQLVEMLEEPQWSAPIARLLEHLDNDLQRFSRMLVQMLARRDQWLRFLLHGSGDAAARRVRLQAAIGTLVEIELQVGLAELDGADAASELCDVARFAAAGVLEAGDDGPITACANLDELPAAKADALPVWRALAQLFLTSTGTWRKRFDRRSGFTPGRDDLAQYKTRAQALTVRLAERPGLDAVLQSLAALPDPEYTDSQWDVLEALVEVLRIASALLKVVFAERAQVDFIEVVDAACQALGPDDAPTDLALAMDYRVGHLLVDEFQDTSHSHEQFLRLLVRGWQPGDGRTLFLVGDPMQSIYRFREADVGVFLRVSKEGLGGVPVEPLRLSANFRSRPEIVAWANRVFPRVLSPEDDAARGAVRYREAQSVRTPHGATAVRLHPLLNLDADAEGQFAAELAGQTARDHADADIAILARSRSHLESIARALRAEGLAYEEVGVEPLAQVPVVRDLLAIARALLHLADRVAWLSLLRAPWCGLRLAEIHALVGADHDATVFDLMADPARLSNLDASAQARVQTLYDIMRVSLANAGRRKLRDRVEAAWEALGGPAIGFDNRLSEAEDFLDLLDSLESEGHAADADRLTTLLADRYASGEGRASFEAHSPDQRSEGHTAATGARIQLMTIHRAKGLEFDTVILPGLSRRPRSDTRPLLAWSERALGRGGHELVLAPLPAAGEQGADAPMYSYLVRQNREHQRRELARLLYVGATRARERLHLVCMTGTDAAGALKTPSADSLLAPLWFEMQTVPAKSPMPPRRSGGGGRQPAQDEGNATSGLPLDIKTALTRFPDDWRVPAPLRPLDRVGATLRREPESGAAIAIDFDWAGETARHVGTVVHRSLQHMAQIGVDEWCRRHVKDHGTGGDDAGRIAPQRLYAWRITLATLGVAGGRLDAATRRVARALLGVISDERGRWLLSNAHAEAESELALTGALFGRVRRVIVDRSFVDAAGMRWIVDYKTGMHEGAGVDDFLDREELRYRPQLEAYAHLFSALESRPIELGLYFPMLKGWRSWAYPGRTVTGTESADQ